MKLFRKIGVWLLISLYLIVSMGFVSKRKNNILVEEVQIVVVDSVKNQFVNEKEIEQLLHKDELHVFGFPESEVNTKQLETLLSKEPGIRKAEVYTGINGRITVEIDQRDPIVRIINDRGYSYYLDGEGYIMPLSSNYTSHLLVANGAIEEEIEPTNNQKVRCAVDKEINEKAVLCNIYRLASYIYHDSFWRSQIEQIYIVDEQNVELIPRVGAHQIILGDMKDFEIKLRNLKAFYRQGLNNIGWNKYNKINLEYENQIICTKR